MQENQTTYIKLIPFSVFNLWDVKRYDIKTNLKFENVVKLKDILIPYRKPVSKADLIKNKWQIISKINFSGELFLRDFEKINSYKGNVNLVPDNAIIYSKINVRHGCIYYHEKGKTPFGVSSEYPTYTFDENKISGKFLHKVLRSNTFKKLLNTKTTGISKARVKQDDFLEIQIPLPSLSEQEKFIDAYNIKIQEAQNLQREADNLQQEIEKYFFDTLGITKTQKRVLSNSLHIVEFSSIEKWGVEYNLGSNSNSILKSIKYKNQRLNEIVEINPSTILPKDNVNISFIPMECISDDYGEVLELREKNISESKGYTKFQEGDLIWARITPCMQNGKSAIVKGLKNKLGCGSTEFHVIRNKNKDIDLNYVYHILRLKSVLHNAMSHFTGSAGQQRVPKSFLEELLIPVPPINIQNRISDKISDIKSNIKDIENKSIDIKSKAEIEFEKQIFN